MRKKMWLLGILATVSMIFSGCGKGTEEAKETVKEKKTEAAETKKPEETTKAAGEETTKEAAGEKKLKIGIVLKTLASEYWVDMADGIREEAEKLGVEVEILAGDSEDDTGGQLQLLEDMVNSGAYDGIGVAPITDTNLINGVAAACKAGIPVVDLDQSFNEEELKAAEGWVVGYCTTDYVVTGEQAGEYLAGLMGGSGQAIIIEGMAGNLSSESRKSGCSAKLEEADIEVVASQPCDWDRQKAMDAVTNLLSVHTDVTGIYCCNDTMALGAQQAVDNLNLNGKVFVVGTDGNSEAVESIAQGGMAGTAAQKPDVIGATCLDMLVDWIKEGKTGDVNTEVETVLLDSYIISRENVEEYR